MNVKGRTLGSLNRQEWEALCDGCARCCLHKLEDADTGKIFYTRVVCRLLDQRTCRCTRYEERHSLVPDCVELGPNEVPVFHWLPPTCAYRLVAEGKDLEEWHPLVSGDPESVHRAGISVRGKVVSEEYVHPDGMEEHIVRWVTEPQD